MILNPYTQDGRRFLATQGDSNLLIETFGIKDARFLDTVTQGRIWTVCGVYAPIRGRRIGGIRAKLFDQKGFIAFCNQRDLEVLLDIVSPGAYCEWLDEEYVEPSAQEWIGPCADSDDLIDDLYDRELEARASQTQPGEMLPEGLYFPRSVHGGRNDDYVEDMILLWDFDRETMMGPDLRFETIVNRWRSTGRTPDRKSWL